MSVGLRMPASGWAAWLACTLQFSGLYKYKDMCYGLPNPTVIELPWWEVPHGKGDWGGTKALRCVVNAEAMGQTMQGKGSVMHHRLRPQRGPLTIDI